MSKDTTNDVMLAMGSRDFLTEILRNGARQMLTEAIENEVAEYLAEHADQRDRNGHRQVLRNGHGDPRELLTGVGPIEIQRPRVNDKRIDEHGERIRFTSKILPSYRRVPRIGQWTFIFCLSSFVVEDFGSCTESF